MNSSRTCLSRRPGPGLTADEPALSVLSVPSTSANIPVQQSKPVLTEHYPVMERLGWPYDVLWPSFRFFTAVRPYGIAHLRLIDGLGEHDGLTPEWQS